MFDSGECPELDSSINREHISIQATSNNDAAPMALRGTNGEWTSDVLVAAGQAELRVTINAVSTPNVTRILMYTKHASMVSVVLRQGNHPLEGKVSTF